MSAGGGRLDRRRFLQAGGAAAASVALPSVLAACGDPEPGPIERAVARRSIGIDYASYYPPVQDIHQLVRARARELGAAITFSHDESGAAAQRRNLESWTGPRGGFRAIAIAPFDAASVESIAAQAIDDDIAVVSYLVPLRNQTAAISVDPDTAAAMLADEVRHWAHGRPGQALLVRPPDRSPTPDPFATLAPATERALRRSLAERAPQIQLVAATQAQGQDDARAAVVRALRDYPDITLALAWNDNTAIGAATALEQASAAPPADLFAGAVAVPGIAGKANLQAIANADIRLSVVAPRLRDLANRLVDMPFALLHNHQPGRGTVTPMLVTAKTALTLL